MSLNYINTWSMANLSNIYSYYVKMKTCGISVEMRKCTRSQFGYKQSDLEPKPGLTIRISTGSGCTCSILSWRKSSSSPRAFTWDHSQFLQSPSFLPCLLPPSPEEGHSYRPINYASPRRGGTERERERLNEDAWRMWKEIESRESGKIRPHLFASRLKSRRVASLLLSNTKDIVSPHRGSINSLQVAFPLWRHWFLLDWASF